MKVIEATATSVKVDGLTKPNQGLRLYIENAYDVANYDLIAIPDT